MVTDGHYGFQRLPAVPQPSRATETFSTQARTRPHVRPVFRHDKCIVSPDENALRTVLERHFSRKKHGNHRETGFWPRLRPFHDIIGRTTVATSARRYPKPKRNQFLFFFWGLLAHKTADSVAPSRWSITPPCPHGYSTITQISITNRNVVSLAHEHNPTYAPFVHRNPNSPSRTRV